MARVLLERVNEAVNRLSSNRPGINLMEVCGTHTMAISSSGIRKAVDPRLRLVSGPGCPVCVTTPKEIDQAIALTQIPNTVVLTFGDMMRVPGSDGSLLEAKARGADVRVVYSPRDGLMMAQREPQKSFVLIGVGFETTAPTVAATVIEARVRRIKNFSVLPLFKLIPPALDFIASSPEINIDGFILPGHVSTVIGTQPYEFLVKRYRIPCCVTGFDTVDILSGILILLHQIESETPGVANEYRRSVRQEGNPQAKGLMRRVFRKVTAEWRGIGRIKNSGLEFKHSFLQFDARWKLPPKTQNPKPKIQKSSCRCGEVMLGLIVPTGCPLFARVCTPEKPFGPCMVSSEGACAAYYKYER
ncbi:MAG: hydrogenase formation protein HypD [candidate division WOR-3 bacterium]